MAYKEAEQKSQELIQAEIRQKLFNVKYAYNRGWIKMNDVVRFIITVYEAHDVPKHSHRT